MAPVFQQRSLPLNVDPERHRLSDWQGSAVVGLPARSEVLFTLSTRQHLPADLRRVKIGAGSVDRLPDIGGELRAGVATSAGTLWLLTLYRLHELKLDPLELLQTYRVPKYGWDLLPVLGGRYLALARLGQKRVPVFSLRSRAIEKALPMPFPQLAMDGYDDTTLFSFWDESARSFDDELRPRGRARPLPIGLTPRASSGAIHFIHAERRIFDRLHPPDPHHTWVYSRERVAVFSPATWAVLREGPPIPGLQALMGYDARGRLIGRSESDIVLISADSLTEIARHACGAKITQAAHATPSGVAFRAGNQQGDALQLVEWHERAS